MSRLSLDPLTSSALPARATTSVLDLLRAPEAGTFDEHLKRAASEARPAAADRSPGPDELSSRQSPAPDSPRDSKEPSAGGPDRDADRREPAAESRPSDQNDPPEAAGQNSAAPSAASSDRDQADAKEAEKEPTDVQPGAKDEGEKDPAEGGDNRAAAAQAAREASHAQAVANEAEAGESAESRPMKHAKNEPHQADAARSGAPAKRAESAATAQAESTADPRPAAPQTDPELQPVEKAKAVDPSSERVDAKDAAPAGENGRPAAASRESLLAGQAAHEKEPVAAASDQPAAETTVEQPVTDRVRSQADKKRLVGQPKADGAKPAAVAGAATAATTDSIPTEVSEEVIETAVSSTKAAVEATRPEPATGTTSPAGRESLGEVRSAAAQSDRSTAAARSESGGGADQAERVRFVERVARAFGSASHEGGAVRMRLHPPDLGSLRLEVTLRDGAMTARLETDTVEAKNLLLDNLPALRDRLAQQEIKIERFEVTYNSGNAGGGWAEGANDGRQSSDNSGRRSRQSRDAAASPAGSVTARGVALPGQGTQLDVFV